jgi:hypothetical protein
LTKPLVKGVDSIHFNLIQKPTPQTTMRTKILALLSLSTAALVFAGCDGGSAQMGSEEANVLGIAKVQKENYSPTGPATFAIHTDELYTRKNYDGTKATFLWGLFTLKDY